MDETAGVGTGRQRRWHNGVLEDLTDAGWVPVRPTLDKIGTPPAVNGVHDIYVESAEALAAGRLVGKSREWRIEQVKDWLREKHTIQWQEWILEEDKVAEDGTTSPRGLTKAATWLVDTGLEVESWLRERV